MAYCSEMYCTLCWLLLCFEVIGTVESKNYKLPIHLGSPTFVLKRLQILSMSIGTLYYGIGAVFQFFQGLYHASLFRYTSLHLPCQLKSTSWYRFQGWRNWVQTTERKSWMRSSAGGLQKNLSKSHLLFFSKHESLIYVFFAWQQ